MSPFFDTRGIITFNTLDDLLKIFSKLTPEKYFEMKQYVDNNYEISKKYYIPEDFMFKSYPFLFKQSPILSL